MSQLDVTESHFLGFMTRYELKSQKEEHELRIKIELASVNQTHFTRIETEKVNL